MLRICLTRPGQAGTGMGLVYRRAAQTAEVERRHQLPAISPSGAGMRHHRRDVAVRQRLNYGHPWDARAEAAMAPLGRLVLALPGQA
jgi:hypothetical protein